ncbi:MAG: leucine--tRNA ligase [Candidatus Yonathbacteria bacterium RIFCSPHIGHO2_01_FULL_44_41]|uniref:Leucine--tRNA ligase n=1 Tax=Candidatus Yonathbacteria bacterium RIFCSPHIGHO2_02_FULL_44_14 TaxID=1802724 RepID=A0A1G2S8D0_9BACT|nr:MAG: leucine--tRNA ligase [Candidatus Yonathbacteria bacterium RIFCSPHIGHO2_01_FULL_44_41]OHA80829.1 MAG: leucine--tRNA ligase [Candidatus Yonathbacteria bacterium RIFCSPLOWO2_01_FULL_43_20]OHA81326.1 MAG: leucine--tRNA ligase [Candidatus Yonathbacteria bacterium RIFCSPHIGHO2_02_FULL_44_14]
MSEKYDHKVIEKKWQDVWSASGVYSAGENSVKPKKYVLDMFPYPSGDGLHVGHPKGYIATDIYSRMKRMQGFNVLHPMGWDAFGLPAEQYAIKNKVHPRVAVEKNTKRYKEQLSMIGFDYDWSREINTTDPTFYKWTQWIFLKMFKKGLAYESYEPINWCPTCQTGLANEDLEDGKCERCDTPIEKKPMRQWVLRITDYADRMLADIDKLDWPVSIKEAQKNWIGRSEGAEIDFAIEGSEKKITVFTTRLDTLFGATYCVLAPEHKLIDELKESIANWGEVEKYRTETKARTEIERTAEGRDKTGVKIEGVSVINPANNENLPLFVADYVLGHYGTGAVMAVPAHDERDFEFAKKFELSIKRVVAHDIKKIRGVGAILETNTGTFIFQKRDANAPSRPGMISSFGGRPEDGEDELTCLKRELFEELLLKIKDDDAQYIGAFGYKDDGTRNILFHVGGVDTSTLTLMEGESIVEMKVEDALNHEKVTDFVKEALIELTDVKKQSVYLDDGRLINSGQFDGTPNEDAKKKITDFVKGRWVTKYRLKDWVFSRQRYWGEPIPLIHCEKCGVVPVPEEDLPVVLPEVESYEPTGTGESPLAGIPDWVNVPCPNCGDVGKRETNTMPQWAGSSWYYLRFIDPHNTNMLVDKEKEKYWSPVDMYVGGAEHSTRHLIYARFYHKFLYDIGVVNYDEPFNRLQNVGLIIAEDGRKMSKRWGNVVNPDDIVSMYGADTMRLYEMFMGPFGQSVAWSTKSIVGPRRFLERVWRLKEKVSKTEDGLRAEVALHKTIKKVGEDIEEFNFNTAISSLMILLNELEKIETVSKNDFEVLLVLLAPFAPHITEELWRDLGNKNSIHLEPWPIADPAKCVEGEVTVAVQVNGKLRDTIIVSRDTEEDVVKEMALARPGVQKWMEGMVFSKIIVVPNKLINIVIKE